MKKTFINLGLALICLLAIVACDSKKNNKVVDEEVNQQETVDEDTDEEDEAEDLEATTDNEDEESATEGDASWEDEVWTSFGGTYFFWGEEDHAVLDFPLPDDNSPVKLSVNDEEYLAKVNEDTGLITAFDSDGNEVFRGYVYAGGNLLKGTYKGKAIKIWGSGD